MCSISCLRRAMLVLALLTALAGCELRPGSEQELGQPVTLDQVPVAAKATIQAQAASGALQDVQQVNVDGQTVYQAHIRVRGLTREVRVSPDGSVLRREDKDDD